MHHVDDANDRRTLARAFEAFQAEPARPTLIIVDSVIGYGAPTKEGTPRRARRAARSRGGARRPNGSTAGPRTPRSWCPTRCTDTSPTAQDLERRGLREAWESLFTRYTDEYPELADQLDRMQRRLLPDGWDADIPEFPADAKGLAGRDASAKVLNAVAARVPWLIGGSADLAPSNKDRSDVRGGRIDFSVDRPCRSQPALRSARTRRRLRGQRTGAVEDAAYQAGFLIFSDFQRGALRLSALMELPVIHIYTHDSIGVGEDGPTHQPVEQLASLRAMPGPDRSATRRRERGRRGLAGDHAATTRPGGADPLPPAAADPGPHPIRPGGRPGQGRLRPRGPS